MFLPADKVLSLIANNLQRNLTPIQAIFAQDLHRPHKSCATGLVVMEEIASKEHEVHLQQIDQKVHKVCVSAGVMSSNALHGVER